jgi:soluble calcium-activated nucleotidase 1
MYNKLSKPNHSVEIGISLKNKIRRMPMDKKSKVCVFCGVLITTLFYVAYALHVNLGGYSVSNRTPDTHIAVERSCPKTKAVKNKDGTISYRIGIITDLDENSKHPSKLLTWVSYFKRGKLVLNTEQDNKVSVKWDSDNIVYDSSLAQGGRAMELSELVCFDGRILSMDDRTGVVYQLFEQHVSPWVIMADGDGQEKKGFKGEWATVKDGQLYIGGLGKEWTTKTGEILNFNPQYVKVIGPSGAVTHISWVGNYKKLLKAAGIEPPGYLIHESAVWSRVHKKWFFLPRRASKLKYDDQADERRGTNMLLSCNEDFSVCDRTFIGPLNQTHGFSSFKFIPGTNEQQIVALKTQEVDGNIASYIMAFDINGRILMREQQIPGSYKFEGIEFL